MEIIINDESFFYEAQQVLMLFFPEGDGVRLWCEITSKEDESVCSAKVSAFGKEGESLQKGKADIRRDIADTVKRAVYFSCRQVSERRLPWGILTGIRPAKPMRQMLESGMGEEGTKAFFKENYYVEEEKIKLAMSIAKSEMDFISRDKKDISVYIGIPFCPTRCSYCSFISHDAGKMIKLSKDYVKHLLLEMEKTAEIIKESNLLVRSVYFGGGTPTALCTDELREVLDGAKKYFVCDNTQEFTVEAGRADTITREKFMAIKEAGAERISINPQTIHNKTLETIGRKHTFEQFLDALYLARETGFENINCDIIAGLPGESFDDFKNTVDKMIQLSPENITVHTLYLKRASALRKQGFSEGDGSFAEKMIEYAQKKLPQFGFKPYYLYKQKATLANLENVGFCKEGYECIYNIDTMSDETTVFALGAGGATKIVLGDRIERIFNFKNADEYIRRFDEIRERKESIKKFFEE